MSVHSLANTDPIDDYQQTILDAFPTGVFICNPSGLITDTNAELCRLFGYRAEELIGKPIEILLPDDAKQRHFAHMQTFWRDPVKRDMGAGRELFGKRKDGSMFPIEIGLNPFRVVNGLQVIASVADITQRVNAINASREIIEAAPIGMLIVDQNGIIEHCNKLLLSTFGYSLDELRGNTVELLIPDRHRSNHGEYRTRYLNSPTSRAMGLERDLTGLHKSGTEIPVEIGLNPIVIGNQKLTIAAIRDITERKKTESKLKQTNADLDEFTYVASHDLRSPLRGISSLVEWIAEDLGEAIPKSVSSNIERMKLRVTRMEKLIDDLLEYARAGRQNGSVNKINISDLIEETIQLVEIPTGFNIRVSGYSGEIQTSPTPLQTVLRNLVSNAVKHHDKKQGEIRINTATDGAYCVFDVADDGPGIPTAAHARVFKLFQTLKNDDAMRSGVGLAVCKRLIEGHGGKIEIHSGESERGTVFRFWWPRFARRDLNE